MLTYRTPYSSVSTTYQGLTTYIKGLSDEKSQQILTDFAENIPGKIGTGEAYKVTDSSLHDAEKYCTEKPKNPESGCTQGRFSKR